MFYALRLFGPPAIVRDDHCEPVRLKRCALLLALLASEPRGIDRDLLAQRLWDDGDVKVRRARLRRLVFETRAQLGETAFAEEENCLRLQAGWLAGCDLHAFLMCHASLVHRGENRDFGAATEVIILAHQTLLGGLQFEAGCEAVDWLEYQRVALASMRRRMRERVVARCLEAGDDAAALTLLLQDLPGDPLDEAGAELAAGLLYRAGRFAECDALFQAVRRRLADELGLDVAPSFHRIAADASARLAAVNVWGTARPKTSYVASGDAHIAYQVFGSGKRDLLLISGFISSVEIVWELPQLANFLARLALHFRVILFDRRGIGLSDRILRKNAGDHTVSDMIAVLDAAGSRSALVFAASEGGPAGIRLSAGHAGRVSGLCLFGTMARGSAGSDYHAALTAEQYAAWLDKMVASWGTSHSLRAFCPSHAEDNVMRDWWARMLRMSSSPTAMALILQQLRDVNVTPLLSGLTCPVTLIHRKGDRAVHIEATRYMAERIPGAHLVELEGDDHFWWMGDNEVVLRELQRLALMPMEE